MLSCKTKRKHISFSVKNTGSAKYENDTIKRWNKIYIIHQMNKFSNYFELIEFFFFLNQPSILNSEDIKIIKNHSYIVIILCKGIK